MRNEAADDGTGQSGKKKKSRQMPAGGWPLLNDQPLREWYLVCLMKDGTGAKVTVVARDRQEACREIVHDVMRNGGTVKRIIDAKNE